MAFYWRPYYEANLNEFGLLMDQPVSRPAADDAAATAQGFSPADFGASQAEPWMRRIGAKIGDWHASPALAYLWDFARQNPYRPEHWSTAATPASPVVIDLLPVSNMTQAKSSGGYLLENVSPTRPHASAWSGIACVLLYNFSRETVSGRVEIEGLPPSLTNSVAHITLAPGERHEMPLELSVSPTEWRRQTLRVRFIPTDEGVAPSVFSTALYPSLAALPATRIADFTGHASESRQTALATRPLASGEPGLHPHGRWLASEGVRVEESADGVWRFHIDYLPAEPLRPAMVELALPDDFAFPSASFLRLQRRKVAPAEASDVFTAPLPAPTPDQAKPRAGKAGDMMDVYFRTENGNLFQTWPRLRVTPEWTQYLESADNFTMAFFGRAAPPWRFSENKPASLVFFLRPSALPATFEVQRAEIVRYGFE